MNRRKAVLIREIFAGFVKVEFVDFWLADQFNSLVGIFMDTQFRVQNATPWSEDIFGQYYDYSWLATLVRSSSTLMTPLLAWIRFLQCLRRFHDDGSSSHLYNTAKYSTSFLKYGMAFYYAQEPSKSTFALMCCAYFCSSAFTLYWDLIHDWGFLLTKNQKIPFLRDDLAYTSRTGTNNFYYFAILENTLLRFSWIVQVSTKQFKNSSTFEKATISTVVLLLEMFRRFIWNFLRLENEHFNNCGEFRTVRTKILDKRIDLS
ncbi:unnamed protein product [Oikopleura dioica]|uniref:EXS domain-containing protein n=1 Tax=Oikopleura dioica TaxID=34765 RepID=E4XKR1_OIKDI|nr:unnamed protein product [Oikopleura dioica]